MKFSIVIVAKDEEKRIGRMLESVQGLSDDIIVCDSGSKDNTIVVARAMGAKVHEITWKGYGISKNKASSFAVYDWVLSMDADEKIDATLYDALKNWEPESNTTVYRVLWKNFFGDQWIRHGNWNNDWKNRLFYRHIANWDDAVAHEDIRAAVKLSYVKMPGYVEHYSFDNVQQYAAKMVQSAILTANKYHLKKKKATLLKIGFSPVFTFFKTYILKAGFMDGRKGALIAVTTAYYTFLKYVCLYELNKTNKS